MWTYPIAGSRPRGGDSAGTILAAEAPRGPRRTLRHVMLVDLARNDLSKVCDRLGREPAHAGTQALLAHPAHFLDRHGSTAPGCGRPRRPGLRRSPAGTLRCAPKPRAIQLIDELRTRSAHAVPAASLAASTCQVMRTLRSRSAASTKDVALPQYGRCRRCADSVPAQVRGVRNKAATTSGIRRARRRWPTCRPTRVRTLRNGRYSLALMASVFLGERERRERSR